MTNLLNGRGSSARVPERAAPLQLNGRGRSAAGLTVIELMVSVLLAAILSAGVFYMTAGQTRGYKTQLTSLTTQQNLWAAMEYLQRQIRMAGFGFGGCPGGKIQVYDGSKMDLNDPRFRALAVYNNCSLYSNTATPACSGSPTDGVDSFTVQYSTAAFDDNMPAVRITNWQNDVTAYTDSCGGLNNGDLVAMWQPGADPPIPCTLLTATNVTSSTNKKKLCTIKHTNGDPYGVNPPGGNGVPQYSPGALVIKMGTSLESLKFAIDKDDADPKKMPRLVQWRNSKVVGNAAYDLEVIANGIEDMQISWACDYSKVTAAPGISTGSVGDGTDGTFYEGQSDSDRASDEWANNTPFGTTDNIPTCQYPQPPAGSCTKDVDCATAPIGAVRITLVGRAPGEELGTPTARRGAAEDRAQGSLDNYGRATLTSIVKPRNMGVR